MFRHHVAEVERQPDFVHVQGHLIYTHLIMSQQDIQQPVLQIVWPRSFVIHQKLLLRLFPQHAVLQHELIVLDFDPFDTIQLDRFKILPQRFLIVIPKDDPMLLKHAGQDIVDLAFHRSITSVAWTFLSEHSTTKTHDGQECPSYGSRGSSILRRCLFTEFPHQPPDTTPPL